MKIIPILAVALILSGCKTTMTVYPGGKDEDGKEYTSKIVMDGNGVGSLKLPDGTEASMDTKTNVNILSQVVVPVVSDVSKAAMTKEMLKD